MDAVYKFGWIPDEERPYEYPNIFAVERTTGPERLVIAPSSQQVSLILDLLHVMTEPFGVLYILIVPRGDAEAGRYQVWQPVAKSKVEQFLRRFQDFFENDGRHHIWISSVTTSDMLVYDNHNVIYAYGRLPEFERILANRGFQKVDRVDFPSPHTNKYNEAFDQDEREVLHYWEWKHFPLQESDDL